MPVKVLFPVTRLISKSSKVLRTWLTLTKAKQNPDRPYSQTQGRVTANEQFFKSSLTESFCRFWNQWLVNLQNKWSIFAKNTDQNNWESKRKVTCINLIVLFSWGNLSQLFISRRWLLKFMNYKGVIPRCWYFAVYFLCL